MVERDARLVFGDRHGQAVEPNAFTWSSARNWPRNTAAPASTSVKLERGAEGVSNAVGQDRAGRRPWKSTATGWDRSADMPSSVIGVTTAGPRLERAGRR